MGWKDWPYWLKGLIIGLLLAILNWIALGFLGVIFFPFELVYEQMTGGSLIEGITRCSGEGCWGASILLGSIGFIIFSTLIGWVVGKIKSKK